MRTRPTDLLQDSTKQRTTRTETHSTLNFTAWITDRCSPTNTPINTDACSHSPSPPSGGGSAPPAPAPLLWCRAALVGRKAARCSGRHAVAGALWGASLRSPAGFPGAVLGVCCGSSVSGFVSVSGGFPWFAGCASGRALVASAGRVCHGRWRLSLASPGILAGVLRRGGRGRLRVVRRRIGLRVGLVVVGRVPAGRSALRRRGGSGVGGVGAGGRVALIAAGRSRRAACSGRVGAGGLSGRVFFRRGGVVTAA